MRKIRFGKSSNSQDSLLYDYDESRKVSLFLSVLMLSLFITNSGDVISELLGGGTAAE